MSFINHNLLSLTSSIYNLELHPGDGYSEIVTSAKRRTSSKTGKVENYRVIGGAYRFSLPLSFVSSSDRFILTEWHQGQTELAYIQRIGTISAETLFVKISNIGQLLSARTRGEFGFFSGNLNLRSSRSEITRTSTNPVFTNFQINQKIQWALFILDDDHLGRLDQTYNRL